MFCWLVFQNRACLTCTEDICKSSMAASLGSIPSQSFVFTTRLWKPGMPKWSQSLLRCSVNLKQRTKKVAGTSWIHRKDPNPLKPISVWMLLTPSGLNVHRFVWTISIWYPYTKVRNIYILIEWKGMLQDHGDHQRHTHERQPSFFGQILNLSVGATRSHHRLRLADTHTIDNPFWNCWHKACYVHWVLPNATLSATQPCFICSPGRSQEQLYQQLQQQRPKTVAATAS